MLGLFKLQGKKVAVHQPSYLTKPAGLATRGREGAPLGRWLGARRGPGRGRGGLPNRRGLIVLLGGVRKARQKSRTRRGQARPVLSPPGHSDGGAQRHPWHLENQRPVSPWHDRPHLEPGQRPPLLLQSPFPRAPLASLLRTRGSAAPHSPAMCCGPHSSGPEQPGNSRVESSCGKVGGPAATPIKNTKKKKSASKVKSSQSENISSNSP